MAAQLASLTLGKSDSTARRPNKMAAVAQLASLTPAGGDETMQIVIWTTAAAQLAFQVIGVGVTVQRKSWVATTAQIVVPTFGEEEA